MRNARNKPTIAAPTHVFTSVNGARFHHLDYGGDGPTIVLLHGALSNAWMWHGVAPALIPHGQVVAIDLRNFGDTQWSEAGSEPTEVHAADVAALAEIHGWNPMRIIGFSIGGLTGLGIWERSPDFVADLVMVEAPPASNKTNTEVPPVEMVVADQGAALENERRGLPHAPDYLVEVMANHGYRPGPEGLTRKHHPAIAERWPSRTENWWPSIDRFDRRLLFVNSADGGVCPVSVATEVAERAPQGELAVISGASHLVPLDRPTAFINVVTEFLEERR